MNLNFMILGHKYIYVCSSIEPYIQFILYDITYLSIMLCSVLGMVFRYN
jgi:hypothetical protein